MSALFPAGPDAFGADELLRLRRETPAWGSYAHFAHGSASLPPQVLYEALDSWLEAERRWGVQRAAEHFAEPLQAVRDSVARVLGTQPRHIALLDCASRAWVGGLCRGPGRPSTDTGDQQLRRIRFQQPVPARRAPAARAGAAPDRRARRRRTAVATARRAVARPRPRPDAAAVAQRGAHRAWRGYRTGGVAERIRAHDGLFFPRCQPCGSASCRWRWRRTAATCWCSRHASGCAGQRDSACSISANVPWERPGPARRAGRRRRAMERRLRPAGAG
ncbi:Uncharacterised protein [Pseudomonas aeruginosa]|nr:Uncharacterised protein [Pseudomonas aeruginosa]